MPLTNYSLTHLGGLAAKFWMYLLKRLRSYGGFKVKEWVRPNLQRSLAAKLYVGAPTVLEVQGRARGPLSPCLIWWSSDFGGRWESAAGVRSVTEKFVH